MSDSDTELLLNCRNGASEERPVTRARSSQEGQEQQEQEQQERRERALEHLHARVRGSGPPHLDQLDLRDLLTALGLDE